MSRIIPKKGTTLRPYDWTRRDAAAVLGYAKAANGTRLIRLRHMGTGRITLASLAHLSRTFRVWA